MSRKKHVILIVVVLLFCAWATVCADQTINVTLDPPKSDASDLRLKHETRSKATPSTEKQYTAQTAKSTSKSKDSVVGQVGVVSASSAAIARMPSDNGYTLFTCPKDTYLAVTGERSGWYGVLMVDGSTGWVPKSKVTILEYQVKGSASDGAFGARVVQTALKYLGIPYKWGGYSGSGIDCSGFVKAVFATHGISLPRVSRDQAVVGTSVGFSELQAGDRLYFACKGAQVDHTGIYMGNGLFIHSSVSNRGVAVDSLLKAFYVKSLVAARRS